MSVLRHFLKELAFRIDSTLQSPNFIRGGHEFFSKFDNAGIRPNGHTARDSIVSRTAKRVTVHGPK